MSTFHSGAGGNYSFTPVSGLEPSSYLFGKVTDMGITYVGTFCLETNEFFNPGGTYNAALSGGAKNGGAGGATNDFDPISAGTAFLYEKFALGGLGSGFSYTDSSKSLDLQNMFWYLEDEQGSYGNSSFTSDLETLLKNKFDPVGQNLTTALSAAKLDYTGTAVQAMNLTGLNNVNERHQDQLFYVSTGGDTEQVPEGGATLGLLSLSVLGLGLMARNSRIAIGASAE
ncbi:MAG: hypothetical protein ABI680_03505 [Chthoniobacteraceae bacterium]